MEHLPQVRLIAVAIHRRVPASVSLEDLVSAGTLGLISAIDRYDSTQGVKLKTYAEHKIRGAILDSLRVLDWAPRQKRRRVKLIESAIQELEKSLGRAPAHEEIAAQLHLSMARYQDWLAETRGMNIASLEPGHAENGTDLMHFVLESEDRGPSGILEKAELRRLLGIVLGEVPKLEQTILSLYFYEGLTLREIAKIVGLHESRISQLKTQAVLRLRTHLRGRWPQHGSRTRQPLPRVA